VLQHNGLHSLHTGLDIFHNFRVRDAPHFNLLMRVRKKQLVTDENLHVCIYIYIGRIHTHTYIYYIYIKYKRKEGRADIDIKIVW
jgi:hypothetical protein